MGTSRGRGQIRFDSVDRTRQRLSRMQGRQGRACQGRPSSDLPMQGCKSIIGIRIDICSSWMPESFANKSKLDLYDFQPHAAFGNSTGRGSGSWGWTAPNGREFSAIGQLDGTAFAEVSKQGKLIYLGKLPYFSEPSRWREIKAYKNYLVVGSEAPGHGIQFFDLRKV